VGERVESVPGLPGRAGEPTTIEADTLQLEFWYVYVVLMGTSNTELFATYTLPELSVSVPLSFVNHRYVREESARGEVGVIQMYERLKVAVMLVTGGLEHEKGTLVSVNVNGSTSKERVIEVPPEFVTVIVFVVP
jgi:hypothetical protein